MTARADSLPLISVVMPSFNQARFLREALESIFRQEYPHLEVVVMDGGSTDGSVDVIRSFGHRLAYWQSQPDGGQAAAINAGVARCSGTVVGWLNSDDYYWRDALWTVGRAYAAHPDRGLYIGNGFRFIQAEERYEPFCRRHIAFNRRALAQGLDYILQPSTFLLRRAWQEVGGLRPDLCYSLDWDLYLRIAERWPAVLINEYLAVSREYEETKTGSGGLPRAAEISRMVKAHTGEEITPGTLFYLFSTLMQAMPEGLAAVRHRCVESLGHIAHRFAQTCGNQDGFPEHSDPQDEVYLPAAKSDTPRRHDSADGLPSISLVTPSFNQAAFLGRTLESIFSQEYPHLESILFDAGSTDGSLDVIRKYDWRLSYWSSEPDRGPAHAINKGFARATGEVLGWLNSDDVLTTDALWEVGRAFAEDPDLDLVFGNALYIDEADRLFLADHGSHRTGLYRGELPPAGQMSRYWSFIYAVPQPTVFFRRRLLEACGHLDESYHFIFDFELIHRFLSRAKVKKIERTQAFYRIHASSKTTDWNKFLVELYRFSRAQWPRIRSPRAFRAAFLDFFHGYAPRKFAGWQPGLRTKAAKALSALSAVTGIGNPEAMWLPKKSATAAPVLPAIREETQYPIDISQQKYRSVFCSYLWPRHPGHSGGEIRDFHLLRALLRQSQVEFYAVHSCPRDGRADVLAPYVDALNTPDLLPVTRGHLIRHEAFQRRLHTRLISRLRSKNLPVLGPRYHRDPVEQMPHVVAFTSCPLSEMLERNPPDFLFVSPQSNPVAMAVRTQGLPTRLVMASYDVESVRVRRMAESLTGLGKLAMMLEAKRAERFERDNLALYDAVIAVSDLDRELFINDYGFAPERVLTIENGVDPAYFRFTPRTSPEQHIVYVGSLGYLPNRQAAFRLARTILPRVRESYPEATLWIVGQGPDEELMALHDGERTIVTGRVEDVRPYLAKARVGCVPLTSGSGTKYKVLEMLSAGVPLVCTGLAAEGLGLADGLHCLLRESDADLADALVHLLEKPGRGDELAENGRALVEQCYAWDANLAKLDTWLEVLKAMPRRGEEAGNAVPQKSRRLAA